jgi:hypothetical protein
MTQTKQPEAGNGSAPAGAAWNRVARRGRLAQARAFSHNLNLSISVRSNSVTRSGRARRAPRRRLAACTRCPLQLSSIALPSRNSEPSLTARRASRRQAPGVNKPAFINPFAPW